MISWIRSWKETLAIMIFHRDIYKALTSPIDFDSDFGEVSEP